MHVTAQAPTRVDLAGGTLDLDPLYLLTYGGLTINAAIALTCTTEVRSRTDGRIWIRSADSGDELLAGSWSELPATGPLGLISRVVKFFRPATGCEVVTCSQAPRGSGLGASSALVVTLCAALSVLDGRPLGRDHLLRTASRLEAEQLGTPVGRQDHYAAVLGGINALWFGISDDRVEPLAGADGDLVADLNARLVVAYAGEQHDSAQLNWQAFKNCIDDKGGARAALQGIKQAALGLHAALAGAAGSRGRDWALIGHWLNEDWRQRQRLAAGIATATVTDLINVARRAGADAAKVCGAGGGGCIVALCPVSNRADVMKALAEAGATVIPTAVTNEGLRIIVDDGSAALINE